MENAMYADTEALPYNMVYPVGIEIHMIPIALKRFIKHHTMLCDSVWEEMEEEYKGMAKAKRIK